MKIFSASCVALLLMVSPVLAADPAPATTAATSAKTTHEGVFEKADANHDGIVTKEEFIAAEAKYFDSVDKNGDGKLTQDEIHAQREASHERWMERKAAKTAAVTAPATTAPAK